jgi:hypothetical protein
MIVTCMLRHCSINLKQALKRANKNISSGCQGMLRQEESNNDVRLRQNENTSQKDSPMFSIIELVLKCQKNTVVEKRILAVVGQGESM